MNQRKCDYLADAADEALSLFQDLTSATYGPADLIAGLRCLNDKKEFCFWHEMKRQADATYRDSYTERVQGPVTKNVKDVANG